MARENDGSINNALSNWRQGDVSLDEELVFVYLADRAHISARQEPDEEASLPPESKEDLSRIVPVFDEIRGAAMLTQTCDVIRDCQTRPFVEVAPLVRLEAHVVEEVRRLKRPGFAYVPATASEGLVADLDRTMTVQKAVVASWTRHRGCQTDQEARDFATALSRKRSRFAFPDDFVESARNFQRHIVAATPKNTDEGAHLRALREIRVRAAPSWENTIVKLDWWFIKENDPLDIPTVWPAFVEQWIGRFVQSGRFQVNSAIACRLQDITAQDYVESDHLDLDRLTVPTR